MIQVWPEKVIPGETHPTRVRPGGQGVRLFFQPASAPGGKSPGVRPPENRYSGRRPIAGVVGHLGPMDWFAY